MAKERESVSLYYCDGSSDKVYHTQLIEQPNEMFVVNFQYGRRGQSLQTGTKTISPVTYEKAKKIFDKLVQEKKSKGYTEGTKGKPYQDSDKEGRISGYTPQLLNPIEEGDLDKYINDENFVAQEKFDGKRIIIKKRNTQVDGINRKGLYVNLPEELSCSLSKLNEDFVIDGELVGDIYHIFDIIEHNNVTCSEPYYKRLERLDDLESSLIANHVGNAHVVPTATNTHEKRALLQQLEARRAEGIVLKDINSYYKPGRPNSKGPQLKFKLYATTSVEVTAINDKRSVQIAALDGNVLVDVGNVTVPPNKKIPRKGDIIEVRYLNYQLGGSLYQPVFLDVRDDINTADQLKTLKLKVGEDDQ